MTRISSVGLLDSQQVSLLFRLQQIGNDIAQNQKRLSTLKSINSAADDPAGLVAAVQLQSEITTLEATSKTLTQARSLFDTADTAAGQIVDQLQQARSLALEAAGGTLSASEIAGNQVELDAILRGLDSLAQTSFGGRRLLDGSEGYRVTGLNTTSFEQVDVLAKPADANVSVSFNVTTQATRASNSYTGGTLAGAATVTVTGPDGAAAVSLSAGATTTDITTAFNAVSYLTGVSATRVDANQVNFTSAAYGTQAEIRFETSTGTFNLTTSGTVAGTDAVATVNGQSVTADGTTFTVTNSQVSLVATVDPAAAGVLTAFTVTGDGLQFTLGSNPGAAAKIGLPNLGLASFQGAQGSLISLLSGGANTLTSGNAAQAVRILDEAITRAAVAQSRLGGFEKYTLESAANVVSKTQENLAAALQARAGTNVPLETAKLTNNQLLQQTTYQALQLFNTSRQNVLDLLSNVASRF